MHFTPQRAVADDFMNYQFRLSQRWMRGAALLSITALMSLGTIACGSKIGAPSGSEQFTGLWEPQVPPEENSPGLFFSEDGRAFFISPNPEDNQAVEMEYALNPDTSPMELDIILPGATGTLRGIVELTGDDSMRLDGAEDLTAPRPTEFSDKTVEFKRTSTDGVLPEAMNVLTKEDIKQIQQGNAPAPAPAPTPVPAPAE